MQFSCRSSRLPPRRLSALLRGLSGINQAFQQVGLTSPDPIGTRASFESSVAAPPPVRRSDRAPSFSDPPVLNPNNVSVDQPKSSWNPTGCDVPNWACNRLGRFVNRVERLFKKRPDKGLGPCAVTYDQYVEDCLVHLLDKNCYEQLSEEDALLAVDLLEDDIEKWIKKWKNKVGEMPCRYIRNHMQSVRKSPFGQFYVLYKIHKGIQSNGCWPTCPVCSDVSSLTHGLGKWVNEQLTPVAQAQLSYFKDSFALKDLLDGIEVPPGTLLFTADATSMYTNIKTEPALTEMAAYLRENKSKFSYPCDALIEALQLDFCNNYFKLGDLYNKQISGTAMGTPPAPPWATCTYGNHESRIIPIWSHRVPLYRRFIDDVIGLWRQHQDTKQNNELWGKYVHDLNGWNGLEWVCNKPSTSITFMDLTITIKNGRLHCMVYQKEQNLYLYIPPHSFHPKGVLTGLIFGQVLRLRCLCTLSTDADVKIHQFYERLRHRGHTDESLQPLFRRAEENTLNYINRNAEDRERLSKLKSIDSRKQVYFHLQFHPEDLPS
ncbi:hypothetical protein ACHAWO_010041 [Cyclotella atomus]|uniref:Uncharacterized protein n=1 Tax=Cyclotella atomus TaxID=382360 RepID=A0ABD3PVJ4_9STRA